MNDDEVGKALLARTKAVTGLISIASFVLLVWGIGGFIVWTVATFL